MNPSEAREARSAMRSAFVLIRSEFGNDLTQYKDATIDRRIERRMMSHRRERLED